MSPGEQWRWLHRCSYSPIYNRRNPFPFNFEELSFLRWSLCGRKKKKTKRVINIKIIFQRRIKYLNFYTGWREVIKSRTCSAERPLLLTWWWSEPWVDATVSSSETTRQQPLSWAESWPHDVSKVPPLPLSLLHFDILHVLKKMSNKQTNKPTYHKIYPTTWVYP